MIPGDPQWLEEHGIDPAVFAERGVERYTASDEAKVLAAVGRFLRPKPGKDAEKSLQGRENWIRRVVAQSGGLIMPKTAAPGFPDVPPQLRPDGVRGEDGVLRGVETDPRPGPYHFHGRLEDQPLSKTTGRRRWPRTPNGKALLHQYVLSLDNEGVQNHIAKHHGGVNTQEVHRHASSPAKYLFLPGSEEARIDLHPRAARMLSDADRVFLVLEGVLKNDAVLSADECVFSVPSVTLWRKQNEILPEELWRFAKEHLEGKMVFVVPDADWIDNPMVDWQALLVRTYLREALGEGLALGDHLVHIAAPPVEFFHAMKREGISDSAKGVDDWLGTLGRQWATKNGTIPGIDGLVIRGKEPGRGLSPQEGAGFRRTRWEIEWLPFEKYWNLRHAATLLSLTGPRHDRSLGSLAGVMDVTSRGYSERSVRILEGLADYGVIKIHGSLEVEGYEYMHVDPKTRSKKTIKRKDWKERPMIEMHDSYVATNTPQTLLGDFWSREAYAAAKEAREEAREVARRLDEIERHRDEGEGPRLRRVT